MRFELWRDGPVQVQCADPRAGCPAGARGCGAVHYIPGDAVYEVDGERVDAAAFDTALEAARARLE